jgi:hypothetical protein
MRREDWKWYGFAGHFILGDRCSYHLSTRVGNYLVSTLGALRVNSWHQEQFDAIGVDPKYFYETMVLPCDGETEEGNPNLLSRIELDCLRYEESLEAERCHYAMCEKWADVGPWVKPEEDEF